MDRKSTAQIDTALVESMGETFKATWKNRTPRCFTAESQADKNGFWV